MSTKDKNFLLILAFIYFKENKRKTRKKATSKVKSSTATGSTKENIRRFKKRRRTKAN